MLYYYPLQLSFFSRVDDDTTHNTVTHNKNTYRRKTTLTGIFATHVRYLLHRRTHSRRRRRRQKKEREKESQRSNETEEGKYRARLNSTLQFIFLSSCATIAEDSARSVRALRTPHPTPPRLPPSSLTLFQKSPSIPPKATHPSTPLNSHARSAKSSTPFSIIICGLRQHKESV